MCNRHYENWRLRGQARPRRVVTQNQGRQCLVDECDRDAATRGMCNRHYENWRLRGAAVPTRDLPIWDRLIRVGWSSRPNGCLEWNGRRTDSGYALFGHRRVHRLVVEHFDDVVLGRNQHVRHTCDNPPCGNRAHLLVGTQADNVGDMMERGRHWSHGRASCRNGHDLTEPGAVKTNGRAENLCVRCDRNRKARHYQSRRARG